MAHAQQTVLVIDDDPHFAGLIASIVDGANYRTVVATDGLSGLRLARESLPSLILCDFWMPGLGGGEVLRTLQADPAMANVPRVLVSGFDCPDLRYVAADAFLTKTINTQALRRLVREFTNSQNVPIAS